MYKLLGIVLTISMLLASYGVIYHRRKIAKKKKNFTQRICLDKKT
jgi:hypothetical protein